METVDQPAEPAGQGATASRGKPRTETLDEPVAADGPAAQGATAICLAEGAV